MHVFIEPKPFIEASIILRKTEQNNINHFKLVTVYMCIHVCNIFIIFINVSLFSLCRYVHVLVQRMVLNVDLGFILSLVDFFSLSDIGMILEVRHK